MGVNIKDGERPGLLLYKANSDCVEYTKKKYVSDLCLCDVMTFSDGCVGSWKFAKSVMEEWMWIKDDVCVRYLWWRTDTDSLFFLDAQISLDIISPCLSTVPTGTYDYLAYIAFVRHNVSIFGEKKKDSHPTVATAVPLLTPPRPQERCPHEYTS